MSWPWAHTSMSRAVRKDLAPIDGPYQMTRESSASVAAASASRRSRAAWSCAQSFHAAWFAGTFITGAYSYLLPSSAPSAVLLKNASNR